MRVQESDQENPGSALPSASGIKAHLAPPQLEYSLDDKSCVFCGICCLGSTFHDTNNLGMGTVGLSLTGAWNSGWTPDLVLGHIIA